MKFEKKHALWILIILVLLLIVFFIFKTTSNDYIKTKKSEDGSKLPEVNLDSNDSKAINQYLEELYNKYTSDGNSKFNYTYEVKDNIISILAIIDEYQTDSKNYVRKYMAFNIDKETKTYISKEEIVSLFNTDMYEVKSLVEAHLKKLYEDEVNERYLEKNECDFNCYLSYMRGIEILTDNVVLVIEKNKLVAYTNFDVTYSDDADYFKTIKDNYYRTEIKEL